MSKPPKRPDLPDGLLWRGEVIHIVTSVNGRRIRRSTGTNNVKAAREQLDALRGAIRIADLTGVQPAALKPRMPLQRFTTEIVRELRADQAARSTLVAYQSVMNRFTAFMGGRTRGEPQVADITPQVMHDFKAYLQQTPRTRNGHSKGTHRLPSPRTVANELDVVRTFLRRAVSRGHLATNPETGIGRPKGAYQHRIRWLTDSEVEALYRAAETWDEWHSSRLPKGRLLRLAIELYLRTGMRSSELQYLTINAALGRSSAGERALSVTNQQEQIIVTIPMTTQQFERCRTGDAIRYRLLPSEIIESDASTWEFDRQREALVAEITVSWRPKTSNRFIPMTETCCDLIEQIQVERARVWSLIQKTKPHLIQAPNPPWLIPDYSGLPWRWKMPYIMAALSERCGISPVVRTHDFRHTFATRLRRAGIALETIKELLGHADIQETMIYAHYQESEGLAALQRID